MPVAYNSYSGGVGNHRVRAPFDFFKKTDRCKEMECNDHAMLLYYCVPVYMVMTLKAAGKLVA